LSHAIEKGLSLNNSRKFFGQNKIRELISLLRQYDLRYSAFPAEMALGALKEYVVRHESVPGDRSFLAFISTAIQELSANAEVRATGGTRVVSEYYKPHNGEQNAGLELLQTRFSCRAFADFVLDRRLVESIVTAAQCAPSQCNRQSVRVHCYQDNALINELLMLQGGASGFGEEFRNLFIVTCELTAWGGAGERNQPYVDGGLFSMSLLLACHAHGVCACPLTLAVGNRRERKIKACGGISGRERLIMMIGFGAPKDDPIKAAKSPRLPVCERLAFH